MTWEMVWHTLVSAFCALRAALIDAASIELSIAFIHKQNTVVKNTAKIRWCDRDGAKKSKPSFLPFALLFVLRLSLQLPAPYKVQYWVPKNAEWLCQMQFNKTWITNRAIYIDPNFRKTRIEDNTLKSTHTPFGIWVVRSTAVLDHYDCEYGCTSDVCSSSIRWYCAWCIRHSVTLSITQPETLSGTTLRLQKNVYIPHKNPTHLLVCLSCCCCFCFCSFLCLKITEQYM